jgi:uncharacterized protein DUF5658
LQRFLWIPVISLFTSNILDRATTFVGLSTGFEETNPAQAWVLAHFPWLFYSSALLSPAIISLMMIMGIRYLATPSLQLHRQVLTAFFFGLSIFSWSPVVSNLLLLRGAA